MLKILFEDPQLLDLEGGRLDFGLDDPTTNKKILGDLQSGKKKIDTFRGVDIFRTGNRFFSVIDDQIVFLVKIQRDRVRSLSIKYVTQVAIWKPPGFTEISGITSHLFWNFLIKMEGVMMSDSQQTDHGRIFWEEQVARALRLDFFVYRVDVRQGTAERIHSLKYAFGPTVYGKGDIFKLYRLVISDVEIEAYDPLIDEAMKILDS